MSLNIYTSIDKIPNDKKFIKYNDSFFETNTEIPDTDYARQVLKEIDLAEYNSSETFIGRTKSLGALNKDNLSTGTKTLLNIITHADKCFSIEECGNNVLRVLLKLGIGNVFWEIPILTTALRTPTDILLNDKIQFKSMQELNSYVFKKEGVDL